MLIDVDPWCGNIQHEVYNWDDIQEAYKEQVKPFGSKVKNYKMFSKEFFALNKEKDFDFIYVDGDHSPEGFTIDADGSFPLLKSGGIMAFDDYEWRHPAGIEFDPKPAMDKWLDKHKDDVEILSKGWQIWMRKK